MITLDEVLAMLEAKIASAGDAKTFAEAEGISDSVVSDARRKIRPPLPSLLDALGLERVVMYRRKDSPDA